VYSIKRIAELPVLFLFTWEFPPMFAVLKNDLLLHEAVIKNDAEAVEEVLKEPLDVNSRNNVST